MINLDEDKPQGIIWIASYPRSGNTWTRAFINALLNVMRNPDFDSVDINRIEEGGAVENAAALYPRFLGKHGPQLFVLAPIRRFRGPVQGAEPIGRHVTRPLARCRIASAKRIAAATGA